MIKSISSCGSCHFIILHRSALIAVHRKLDAAVIIGTDGIGDGFDRDRDSDRDRDRDCNLDVPIHSRSVSSMSICSDADFERERDFDCDLDFDMDWRLIFDLGTDRFRLVLRRLTRVPLRNNIVLDRDRDTDRRRLVPFLDPTRFLVRDRRMRLPLRNNIRSLIRDSLIV